MVQASSILLVGLTAGSIDGWGIASHTRETPPQQPTTACFSLRTARAWLLAGRRRVLKSSIGADGGRRHRLPTGLDDGVPVGRLVGIFGGRQRGLSEKLTMGPRLGASIVHSTQVCVSQHDSVQLPVSYLGRSWLDRYTVKPEDSLAAFRSNNHRTMLHEDLFD